MFMDIKGDPDGIDGADVTLAVAVGYPEGVEVEMLDEVVCGPDGNDAADPEGALTAVLLEEILGSPAEAV